MEAVFVYIIGGVCCLLLAFIYRDYYKKMQEKEDKEDPWYRSNQDGRWGMFYFLLFFGLFFLYLAFSS